MFRMTIKKTHKHSFKNSNRVLDPDRLVTHQSSEEWYDPEMLRQCPFDPVHVIQAYRYQQHILRCPKKSRKGDSGKEKKNRVESTGN